MRQYEQLFKAVSKVVQQAKDAKEESRLRGEQFNIFKVCGIDHYELQHSAIIAELLNPQGSHGQGCQYLILFLKAYGSKLNVTNFKPKDIDVQKEEWTTEHDGRMDICVKYKDIPLVIIENKLYASDQSIQLRKYDSDALQRGAKEYDIVYLTLDGKDASEDSGRGVSYFRMSYSKDIIKWLEMCIEHSSRIPLVRETLIQYQNHIKQLTHQEMEKTDLSKLFQIMSQYPRETVEIQRRKWDYFKYTYEQYAQKQIIDEAAKMRLLYEEDELWSDRSGGLFFHKPEWQYYAICIWHDTWAQGFYDGVSSYKENSPKMKIHTMDCMKDKGTENLPYGYTWLCEYKFWNENTTIDIINGKFAETIVKRVKDILNEIETKQLPML